MSHPFGTRRGPKLTDLSDVQKLHGLIDHLFTGDRRYKKHTRKIIKLQHRHQELASDDAFLAYLDVEAATNERVGHMLITVARWAFDQGKAARQRPALPPNT